MTRTAIYIRKSREDKAKPAHRLTVQREQLPAYAHSQGWQYEVYDDGHASAARGKTDDLQARARLERDIRAGKINVILTIELSRLSRDDSMQDFVAWLHLCGEYRVKLATMSRMLDPSQHSDWMLLLMEGGFSSVEMKVLQARMKEGRAQAFAEGKFLGGKVPPPYIYDKKAARPVIDPGLLVTMQRVWQLTETMSARAVANTLSMPHIAVRRAISDERLLYYQAVRLNPQTGEQIFCEWEPCMAADQAEKIMANRKSGRRGYHRPHAGALLSNLGIFTCGYCGRSIRSWNNHRVRTNGRHDHYSYYGCKANETKRLCEKSRMILQEIINERIITNLLGTLADINELRAWWKAAQQIDTTGEQLRALEKQIAILQAKKQRLTAAVVEGVIDFADAKQARTKIDTDLETTKQQQSAIKGQQTAEPNWRALTITREEFGVLTTPEQREIITLAIKQIRFFSGYLLIEYRFPRSMSGDPEARIHLPPAGSKPTQGKSLIYRP